MPGSVKTKARTTTRSSLYPAPRRRPATRPRGGTSDWRFTIRAVPRTAIKTPSELLCESLAASRTDGVPWAEAWDKAVREALTNISTAAYARREWLEVVNWAHPYFRAAYMRRGPDPCGRFALYECG